MQHARGTIDGHLTVGDAAGAEVNLHAPRLVNWAIAQQPQVAVEQLGVLAQDGLQMRRERFLFTFKEDFQMDADWQFGRAQSVQRGEQRLDGRFVVTGGAGINAPLRVDWTLQRIKRDGLAVYGAFAQHRLPRIIRPLGFVYWLTVVVRVPKDRVLGPRRGQLAIDCRWTSRHRQQLRLEAARLQKRRNALGVGANVGGFLTQDGHREKL